ncbi:MAG: hypothetical protein MJY93_10630, partial [Fibrobacter sp.]|nr:hypothetical protein [Fibrobacter sp.]
MMRNSINSCLTTLVITLACAVSANASEKQFYLVNGSQAFSESAIVAEGNNTLRLSVDESNDFYIYDETTDSWGNFGSDLKVPYLGEGSFGADKIGFKVEASGYYDIYLEDRGNGTWYVSFTETKAEIESVADLIYTEKAITPKPAVILGTLDISEGTDYEYSYTNNVNVGSSATVTVTFKGDYAEFGSVSKSFNITKAT